MFTPGSKTTCVSSACHKSEFCRQQTSARESRMSRTPLGHVLGLLQATEWAVALTRDPEQGWTQFHLEAKVSFSP